MCYFSSLFCRLPLRVLFKHLWSLNSQLAGKQAQKHYSTFFTAGLSQLLVALNYGIHVFESVFKEGFNWLYILHSCSSIWQRTLILIRILLSCTKEKDEYQCSFIFLKAFLRISAYTLVPQKTDSILTKKWQIKTLNLDEEGSNMCRSHAHKERCWMYLCWKSAG